MKFDIISIVYLVILLIYVLIGLKKGFFKTLTGLIKSLLSLLIALFLAKPLTNFVMDTGIGTSITSKIESFLVSKDGIFVSTITSETKTAVIADCLTQLNIPQIFHSFLTSLIDKYVVVGSEPVTVAKALAPSVSYYLIYIVVFILLFVVGLIICAILNRIFDKLSTIPLVGILNKLLGVGLNLIIGLVIICVLSYGLTFLVPLDNSISSWLVKTMGLENSEFMSISKYFYEHNFLLKIIAFFQKLFS